MKINRIIYKVIACCIALSLSNHAMAQINAEQCITIGRNVLSMDDYLLSIQYFNQAIKAKPYLSDPYFYRGLAKLYLEDYKGAEEDCSMAIERNKYKIESYKVRGFARQYLGKDSLAVEDYKIGLADNPDDKYFLFYKGVAETELKRYAEADSTLNHLLRLHPKFEDGVTARARLRLLEGDTIRALDDLTESINLSNTNLNPYLMRAEILAKNKKWKEAAADMDEAIRLQPQETDFYLNRAYLRYNSDDYFGAMADYNYALELRPYNAAALFNRALLRYEVRDLRRSAKDFEEVLKIEPDNFHARYNRALILLEAGDYKEAIKGFDAIIKRYPRFYPAFYAKAEAYHKLGDMRSAIINVHSAEELIKKYVKNPKTFKLDRPMIAQGTTNTKGHKEDKEASGEEESDIQVMERFNQLVTVSATDSQELAYNEKIKGRVQDRDINVELQPAYMLAFSESPQSLKATSNFFRELEDFNHGGYIKERIYLISGLPNMESEEEASKLFDQAAYYEEIARQGAARPADWLALGIYRTQMKDFEGALQSFDNALEGDPHFTVALMARAFAKESLSHHSMAENVSQDNKNASQKRVEQELQRREEMMALSGAMADYDEALKNNPHLIYAWLNKGNILYNQKDFTSALQCYTEALNIDPAFGAALFNRGMTYLQMGNKRQAFVDLSKAGEAGVMQSYNLLKRMK